MNHAYQDYDVEENEDGTATVYCATNDDDDDGHVDCTRVTWELHFKSMAEALKYTGITRVGVSGIIVTVSIEGSGVYHGPRRSTER
jgi:hypothetical protein